MHREQGRCWAATTASIFQTLSWGDQGWNRADPGQYDAVPAETMPTGSRQPCADAGDFSRVLPQWLPIRGHLSSKARPGIRLPRAAARMCSFDGLLAYSSDIRTGPKFAMSPCFGCNRRINRRAQGHGAVQSSLIETAALYAQATLG